jgi:hypothetical protein
MIPTTEEVIVAFLKERAVLKTYVRTRDIAEALGLTNNQAGYWMGQLIRKELPGMQISRYSHKKRSSRSGSAWRVDLLPGGGGR